MVGHRAGDPVLAPHRACSAVVAGDQSSLLVWLAGAGEFSAVAVSEVSRRDTSLLQRDRVYSDDDRHVLPHVPTKGRRERGVYLLAAPRTAAGCRCLIV